MCVAEQTCGWCPRPGSGLHGVLEGDKSRSTGAAAGKAGATSQGLSHGDADSRRTLMTPIVVLTYGLQIALHICDCI